MTEKSSKTAIPPSSTAEALTPPAPAPSAEAASKDRDKKVAEIGGPAGPEPTRYGDWERKGRCVDF